MNTNRPDLLLEGSLTAPAQAGRMPLVDAPRVSDDQPQERFDWRPTMLIVGIGASALLAAVYLL